MHFYKQESSNYSNSCSTKFPSLRDIIVTGIITSVFFQVCGHILDRYKYIHDTEYLCGFYLCDRGPNFNVPKKRLLSGIGVPWSLECNNKSQCMGDLDELHCPEENDPYICEDPTEKRISRSKLCDGKRDCHPIWGVDEANCNHSYGISCTTEFQGKSYDSWVSPHQICNGRRECSVNGEDELNCNETANKTQCIPGYNPVEQDGFYITDSQKCWRPDNDFPVCFDGKDQLNCTENISLQCDVKGFNTSVTDLALCTGYSNCDDKIDNNCEEVVPNCKVHKHMTCDGIPHNCGDGVDESLSKCGVMTENFTCYRRVFEPNRRKLLPQAIPRGWACDGIRDCIGGQDEDKSFWTVCSENTKFEHCIEKHLSCRDVFICDGTGFVKQENLCRNRDNCDQERKVCETDYDDNRDSLTQAISFRDYKFISHCVPGVNLVKDTGNPLLRCEKYLFHFGEEAYGTVQSSLFYPVNLRSCKSFFGELYVYLSCLGICPDAKCPLQKIVHDSCYTKPGQFFTLTKQNTLTITKRLGGGRYTNELFPCKNKQCITYDKVCNLRDDCGDGSDEENCQNHFYCESDGRNISITLKCNGHFDCADGLDECNEDCTCQIINSGFLKATAWIQGILATVFNLIVAANHLRKVKEKFNNKTSLTVAILVILVSIGDMFVGLYLIILAVQDTIKGNDYCTSRYDWLKSFACTFLGVLNSIGTQTALFSMMFISVFRAWVMKTQQISSRTVDKRYLLFLVITIFFFIIFPSFAFSIAPVLPRYQEYFMNGIYYGKDNLVFKGIVTKEEHITTIRNYHGRFLGADNSILSWQEIRKLVNSMFTTKYGGIKGDNIGFFGNEGVCLFKYFVQQGDPKGAFTWCLLTVNLICFVVIACCYIYINYINLRSANKTNTEKSRKKAQNVQRRISVIILTDFLCWVPCIIICLLHYMGVINATNFYPYFSILILPINSLINPLIYDNTLFNTLMLLVKAPSMKIVKLVQNFRTSRSSEYHDEKEEGTVGLNAMVKSTVTVATMIETELKS